MALRRHLRMIAPYLMEVFVRSKAAWGGGAIIIAVGIIEHAAGRSLSEAHYAMALMLAVIGSQFWHGLLRVSARHSPPTDLSYDLWVDEHDFLRCVEHRTSATEEP